MVKLSVTWIENHSRIFNEPVGNDFHRVFLPRGRNFRMRFRRSSIRTSRGLPWDNLAKLCGQRVEVVIIALRAGRLGSSATDEDQTITTSASPSQVT